MSNAKKIYIIIALVLYVPFMLCFVPLILWQVYSHNMLPPDAMYEFLLKIENATETMDWLAIMIAIFLLISVVVIATAELSMHRNTLSNVAASAEKEKEENLKKVTTYYETPTVDISSDGRTAHIYGGYRESHPILNFNRIIQVFLYIILIGLCPIIFPFDAIIHLIKYR